MSTQDSKQLEFEIRFYERLLLEKPDQIDLLTLLAECYTRHSDYLKGYEIDSRLTTLKPNDPIARYNLACSLALIGKVDEAFSTLDHAIQLGYRDLAHLKHDKDLETLKKDPRYPQLIQKLLPA